MICIGECNHVRAFAMLFGELDRRFDSVCTRWSGELDFVVHRSRLQNRLLKPFQELSLGLGRHVQRMLDPVARDVVQQCLLHHRRIMPIVQRSSTTEEIDELTTFRGRQCRAICCLKDAREESAIATHL